MKCPLCSPGRWPDWPLLRQVGIEDWLRCPICKTVFYGDGGLIKEENLLRFKMVAKDEKKGEGKSSDNPFAKKK